MPRVSSRDNPRLKQAARLVASSRDRRKAGRCVLEGEHVIAVYCERYGAPETLIVVESALEREGVRRLLDSVPAARSLIVTESAWAEFAQFPPGLGAMAVVAAPRPEYRASAGFCLLLDGIQDPGNVGSILRTAAAAGVEQVLLSAQCAFAWSPKVLRAGQGAHFHLQIFEDIDLVAWAGAYQGKLIAAVAADGEPLFTVDLTRPVAIAIGNEGAGLSDALRFAAARRVTIPMPGGFDSLNAAAAAAVCLFECVRQRNPAK
ncbi:MAG TPA: RNA methyltransferase [Casimicrobiaceae bacterium]|nr:RNA methyltransferase [Casimicrobiaceae bacterium]